MSDNSNPINIVDALPANPTEGMVVTFDEDMEYNGTTLSKDNVWQWNGTTWVVYNGSI